MSQRSLWQPPAWIPPAIFTLIGAAMLVWNPDAWLHPLIDYGRELYVPWRISAGDVLYRDLAHFNGPFSPYFNAIWFKIFGGSVHVLTAVNVAVVAGVCALLYRLIVSISDRFTATVGGIVFLTMFAFQHYDFLGNFSWLAPYSHEMTHGVALGLLSVWLLSCYASTEERRWLLASGLVMGLCFLTKPETFAATALATNVGLVARGRQRLLRDAITLNASTLVFPMLAFVLLAIAMPVGDAFAGLCGGWRHLLNERLTGLIFYAECRGTNEPYENLALVFKWLIPYVVILSAGLGLACWVKPGSRMRTFTGLALICALPVAVSISGYGVSWAHQPIWPWLGFALLVGTSAYFVREHVVGIAAVAALPLAFTCANLIVPWDLPTRPVLLFALLIGIGLILALVRRRDATSIRGLLLWTFAVGLLAKIILNVRFNGYGFGLSVPVALLCVTALTYWLPKWVLRRGWSGDVYRGACTGLIGVFVVAFLQLAAKEFADKNRTLSTAHEQIRYRHSPLTRAARVATEWLQQNTRPDESVMVFPEGIGINYFARRLNPTGFINFMPPEVIMFKQPNILAALEANPPDVAIMIHRATREYGMPLFGTHYGRRLKAWIDQNYVPVKKYGPEPLHTDRLTDNLAGMWILRRRQ